MAGSGGVHVRGIQTKRGRALGTADESMQYALTIVNSVPTSSTG
jgi:hypothetical protein